MAHLAPQAPEQPHIEANPGHPRTPISRNRTLNVPERARIGRNRAARLAVFATILPFLPPITPNVKLPRRANRLEYKD
jgi:hypothetical protein